MTASSPPFVTDHGLAALDLVAHGFFGRLGGTSEGLYASLNCGPGSGDRPEAVQANRARALSALDLPAGQLVTLYQIHSADAVPVSAPWAQRDAPRADGMASRTPGVALGILTADCCPVLFADAEGACVGAAHAGWKGAVAGVLEATLEAMESLGAQRGRIRAALGPTISQANYEVGPDFRDTVLSQDPEAEPFFAASPSAAGQRADKAQFDLPAYVQHRLRRAGLTQIGVSEACTYADPDGLFSYRRTTHRKEGDYGRNLSVVALRPT